MLMCLEVAEHPVEHVSVMGHLNLGIRLDSKGDDEASIIFII